MADLALFSGAFSVGLVIGLYCKKNNIELLQRRYDMGPLGKEAYYRNMMEQVEKK